MMPILSNTHLFSGKNNDQKNYTNGRTALERLQAIGHFDNLEYDDLTFNQDINISPNQRVFHTKIRLWYSN